ncbi:disease resistance protein RGA1 [Canna indica]|uniref:Disease resistance protein RGA1 n=1 Tax=Canna indica TaxID=4628 RepID=A0AAQ3KVA1_9LILI|nr:disease resistance protein RGA1 [Canna indica]
MSVILTALGWLTDSFIGSLVQKASDYAIEQWFGVQEGDEDGNDLSKLKSTLLKIQPIISKAENMWIKDDILKRSVNALLMQLKDAAYDADDLLDEFRYRALQQQIEQQANEASSISSSSSNVPPTKKIKLTLSNVAGRFFGKWDNDDDGDVVKVTKELQGRLDSIATDIKEAITWIEADGGRKKLEINSENRSTSSIPIESQLFGREKELEKLKGLLRKPEDGAGFSDSSISVLTIVGIGGVGKTTLAQHVYNKLSGDCFDCKFWVCVSENFSVERLTREIIESTTRQKCDLMNFDTLRMVMQEKIASKKFLLVLDDVWHLDTQKWESFCAPLRSGARGSKILITTRHKHVADMVSSADPINLHGLDDKSYWEYFEKCAFGSLNSANYPQLEAMAKRNICKLKGLPLAARTLGGLLKQNMDEKHWETILESEIWKLQHEEDDVLPVLQLSYQYLPTHLKRCFAFCSLFPKDHRFDEHNLIEIWMAEGFIASKENRRMEDIGSNYFRELVNRSFFHRSQDERCYVMHDLIHDLAVLISEGECCRVEDDKSDEIFPNMPRHLSMISTKLQAFNDYSKLRTLMLHSSSPKLSQSLIENCQLFERLRSINVLILTYSGLQELPESIGRLIHLRYLNISSNSEIQNLPDSLCRLYNLQTLILTNCDRLQSLPQGISKLINLRHLDAQCKIISNISQVGKLTSLQELPVFKVLKQQGHKIKELNPLRQLHGTLRITNLENVESKAGATSSKLQNKRYLEALKLKWAYAEESSMGKKEVIALEDVLEGLQPHRALKSLTISGYSGARSPSWLKAEAVPNLENLKLKRCRRWQDLSFIAQLPHLKFFLMEGNREIKEMISRELHSPKDQSRFFPMLEELVLTNLSTLEVLPNLGQLPRLKILRVEGVPEMKTIGRGFFGGDFGKCFPSLGILTVRDMPELEEWSWIEDQELFPCLHTLEIYDCVNLKRLPPLPYSLKQLDLSKLGLTELPTLQIDGDTRSNMTSLLSVLHINNCPNLRSLQGFLTHHFPVIKSIQICACKELVWLPAKNFKELTSLEELSIKRCPKLMTQDEESRLVLPSSIKKLELQNCGDLSKSLPNCLRNLSSLTKLSIKECLHVASLPREPLIDLKELEGLSIEYCEELRSIEGLGVLKSLKSLTIIGCPYLASLLSEPQIELEQLKSMSIEDCDELRSIEGLGMLKALKSLTITGCENLRSITGFHALSSLQSLSIEECPEIESVSSKGLPASLTNLYFSDCHPMLEKQLRHHKEKRNNTI